MKRIGFIGLGLMGNHMARRLLRAEFPLTVWNRDASRARPLVDDGASLAESPADMASQCDVIITMVTNSAASYEVICGDRGILNGSSPGLVVIDMGSIAPEVSRDIGNLCRERGVDMLDAPVTGAPKVAAAGKLGIMVGGERTVFEQCRPILEMLSAVIVYAGSSGQGSTLKLINNLILGVAIEAISESLVLAQKSGIDPQCVLEITSVGGARTGAMETRGPKIIEGKFDPGFSISNMYKDLSNVMQLADQVGAVVPTASASLEILRAAKNNGMGELDSCSVVKVLRSLANISQD